MILVHVENSGKKIENSKQSRKIVTTRANEEENVILGQKQMLASCISDPGSICLCICIARKSWASFFDLFGPLGPL